ncbi:MAG: hypothetical protein RLZ33_520 [Bacteroidota bacterium]|jgi:hypothetical protein
MKFTKQPFYLLLLLFVFRFAVVTAQETPLKDSTLIYEIYDLYLSDQRCREQLRKFNNHELDSTIYKKEILENSIRTTDSVNFYRLKKITDTYGFPGYTLVGEDFSDSFWNLVQHQDNHLEYQKEVLALMKIEVDKKNASGSYYAYLTDRVLVNSNEEQEFGTQMRINEAGTSYEPKPVIDPTNLNTRRASVGLTTIEEYIQLMNTRYSGNLSKEE